MVLPVGFVYLQDVDPSIVQDMRYAGYHNFVGRPIAGYKAPTCILTTPAAQALKSIQAQLKAKNLSLKVYDCYRPQKAVDDFYAWSQKPGQTQMQAEFYPRIDKSQLFNLEYIASRSSHTMGSTVDLTLVPLPTPQEPAYVAGQALVACYAALSKRFHDNSIDMGTGFDCLDPSANYGVSGLAKTAEANRDFLKKIMLDNGFEPYRKEWWHFTYRNQPFADEYFNFDVK